MSQLFGYNWGSSQVCFVNISLTMNRAVHMCNLEGGYCCLDSTLTKLKFFVGWILLKETICVNAGFGDKLLAQSWLLWL
jgi:hypothetical protein